VLFVNERLITGRDLLLLTRAEASELITAAVDRLREAGVEATGTVRPASHRHVATTISDAARECDADAIVLGSRRRRRAGRVFSSRVRERTLRVTSLPVLTAPSPLEIGNALGCSGADIGRFAQFDLEEILRTSR
jgi:nucleotide-binding universal stress UspA family protein